MFSLNIVILALLLYITVSTVEFTNTENASDKDWPPLYSRESHPTLKTIFVDDNKNGLARLRWHNVMEKHPTAVNLTIYTHTFDGQGYIKVWDIVLPPDNVTKLTAPTSVAFLRGDRDRVFLAWTEDNKVQGEQLWVQLIFTDTCKASDYSIQNVKYSRIFLYMNFADYVMKFSDHFEILVKYPLDFLTGSSFSVTCKYAINYDGKPFTAKPEVIKNVSFEKMHVYEGHGMKYNGGEGYVFFTGHDSFDEPDPKETYVWFAYTPNSGWILLRPDISVPYYSNSSGFTSACWIPREGLFCKGLDSMHELKETMRVEVNWNSKMSVMDFSMINSPNGRVVLLHLLAGHFLAADEIQKNGQCKLAVQQNCCSKCSEEIQIIGWQSESILFLLRHGKAFD